jgi:hypothetical protein
MIALRAYLNIVTNWSFDTLSYITIISFLSDFVTTFWQRGT